MKYKIIRLDGQEDKQTRIIYDSYDDAYDNLEKIFGNLCCSDADYDVLPCYDIVKV